MGTNAWSAQKGSGPRARRKEIDRHLFGLRGAWGRRSEIFFHELLSVELRGATTGTRYPRYAEGAAHDDKKPRTSRGLFRTHAEASRAWL
jgi:hypothetical protein